MHQLNAIVNGAPRDVWWSQWWTKDHSPKHDPYHPICGCSCGCGCDCSCGCVVVVVVWLSFDVSIWVSIIWGQQIEELSSHKFEWDNSWLAMIIDSLAIRVSLYDDPYHPILHNLTYKNRVGFPMGFSQVHLGKPRAVLASGDPVAVMENAQW